MSISSDVQTQLKVLTAGINSLVMESLTKDQKIAALQAQVLALQPKPRFVWSNINEKTGWLTPANVGDTGGGNNLPPGTSVLIPGHPLTERFTAGHPWNDAYCYKELDKQAPDSGAIPTAADFAKWTNFKLSLDLSLLEGQNKWQAFEFELQLAALNQVYNMAWQLRPDGTTLAFQFTDKVWIRTDVVFWAPDLDQGKTLSLVTDFTIDQVNHTETHTRFTNNGGQSPVSFSQLALVGGGPYFHAAFQVDADKNMDPITLAVGNMTVEAS